MTLSNRPKKPREPLTEAALFDYATASLGRRAQTVAELKRKLRTRVETDEAGERKIAAVVAKLKEYRFLNDANFAAEYTRLRQANDKLGRRRVQQGLMQKGVHPELVASTLETAYENVNEEQLARAYIERKRMAQPKDKKEAALTMRRLVAAGFTPPTVFKVLRKWVPDEESLEGLDADPES
ncbi:MAG: regulatory protein [Acidobacteriaceae bacterium]|jgi:regulatory protein|nr:regulatory protein [Acidobacteriaceae bacterium]MDT7812995.1 regulatory protein [Acidobacteriaceae bacterium]